MDTTSCLNRSIYGNPITSLPRTTFLSSLKTINFNNSGINNVRGCKWPNAIYYLWFPANTALEVRESDFAFLSTVELEGAFQQEACADPTARLATIGFNQLCVISDARFEELYGAASSNVTGSQREGDVSLNATRLPPSDDSTKATGNSSKSVVVIVLVVGGAVVMLVLVLFVCWKRKKRQSSDDASDNGYIESLDKVSHTQATQPTNTSGFTGASDGSQEFIQSDIRNDAAMRPFRLNEREIELTKLIARGGFGIIHQAIYRDQDVAVKQMLPGTWHDSTTLSKFMDGIRLCATLNHPKIVSFVGITWTSPVDQAVVTEFMAGGDLHDLLYKHAPSTPSTWFEVWTSTQGQLMKTKARIAKDVVEGLMYLHAFPTPVLHRDLKARNVLLDTQGNAKLSDFGISRELVLDKTMTREVGTSAWIAPEVLRGERYSEKADIYSLGVLLVEMDRCGHPYGSQDMKCYQVAVLVSTGSLRPETTAESPAEIRSLAERCVAFDPASRPTVTEVLSSLQGNTLE